MAPMTYFWVDKTWFLQLFSPFSSLDSCNSYTFVVIIKALHKYSGFVFGGLWEDGTFTAPRSDLHWPMKGEQPWSVLSPGGSLKSQCVLCHGSPFDLVTS